MAAPTGRAANPTAYVANAASVPAYALESGKNSFGKTSAAAVPYRKKSYHSIDVPITLEKSARRTCLRSSGVPLMSASTARAVSFWVGMRLPPPPIQPGAGAPACRKGFPLFAGLSRNVRARTRPFRCADGRRVSPARWPAGSAGRRRPPRRAGPARGRRPAVRLGGHAERMHRALLRLPRHAAVQRHEDVAPERAARRAVGGTGDTRVRAAQVVHRGEAQVQLGLLAQPRLRALDAGGQARRERRRHAGTADAGLGAAPGPPPARGGAGRGAPPLFHPGGPVFAAAPRG